MNYSETLSYLYAQLPMYQRVGDKALKKTLDNIKALLTAMGNPQSRFKSIHIAGTNGKGTVAHILSAILQDNDLKVGLYTSPHYKDFRERIKIDGKPVHKNSIIGFVRKYRNIIEEINPSFFEITVAMAFKRFADAKVDIAVVETGLGGRLDSTNVIMPILSIITNISYDHQDQLGDTLPEIALEKAGIIKYSIPTVIGEYQEEVIDVFEKATLAANSPLHLASQVSELVKKDDSYTFNISGKPVFTEIKPRQENSVFLKNLKTALYAAYVLRQRLGLKHEVIAHAITDFATTSYYMGRFQQVGVKPDIILDSAHNAAGLNLLFQDLALDRYKHTHIVIGFVKDKDVNRALRLFPEAATYYFCAADIPRALDVDKLHETAVDMGLKGLPYSSVAEAYQAAQTHASEQDLILVCGSIFVVAEVV